MVSCQRLTRHSLAAGLAYSSGAAQWAGLWRLKKPGYQFGLGGSAHILTRPTPIVDELELGRYGLEYIELDPLLAAPSPESPPLYIIWHIRRDSDQTAAALEDAVTDAGDSYRSFLDDWSQFAKALKNMFLVEPTPWQLGRSMLFETKTPLPWSEAARSISRPYGDVVEQYFENDRVQAF